MKTYPIAVLTLILGVSALPSMADSMETQTFSATGTTTALGLLPFNTALGTLDSVTILLTTTGIVPDGDSGAEFFSSSADSATITDSGCMAVAGCSLAATLEFEDFNPAALLSYETSFAQGFTVTGTVTNPTLSGTLTYDYTASAVPEPASWALLLTVAGMCFIIVKKRIASA